MAYMSINSGTTRKMSFGFNGKMNGVEGKTPFLIGVSGGTASGKVGNLFKMLMTIYMCIYMYIMIFYLFVLFSRPYVSV